jgi:hypothetical protein
LGPPFGRIADTLAVLVQAEMPQLSAEMTVVPLGMTAMFSYPKSIRFCVSLTSNDCSVQGKIAVNSGLPIIVVWHSRLHW